MDQHATALADAIEATLPGWVERCVTRVLAAHGVPFDDARRAAAADAATRAANDVVPRVRALLAQDVDAQTTNPLSILRSAVRYPTGVLRHAGIPPARRDDVQVRLFPDDDYDLTPASFADVDPSLVDLGIAWGASKAMTHLRRRRSS